MAVKDFLWPHRGQASTTFARLAERFFFVIGHIGDAIWINFASDSPLTIAAKSYILTYKTSQDTKGRKERATPVLPSFQLSPVSATAHRMPANLLYCLKALWWKRLC